jgi:hypothetical protein
MIKKNFFAVALLFCFALLPGVSQAYESTAQSAVALDARTFLYTVEYEFGFLNAEVWLPIGAARTDASSRQGLITYKLEGSDGTPYGAGESYAVVLSDAKVVDGKYYYVPKGGRETFTLVTIVRTPPLVLGDDLALQVTALPYTLLKNGVEKKTSHLLDSVTLTGYRTPALEFAPGK